MLLTELASKIQETAAALAESRAMLAQNPDDVLLTLDLASLEKRQADLQQDFRVAADAAGVNVLQYRVFKEHHSPIPVRAVAGALDSFQSAFSVFFDAISTGATKTRGRVSAKAAGESAFGFAYAFTGSLGFALTLPREHLLLGEPIYERAIAAFLETTRVKDPSELRQRAKTLGVATVRAVYKWAETLSTNGLGAELDWTAGRKTAELLLQRPELENLRSVIGLTSDTNVTTEKLAGTLFAIDTKRRTFGFLAENASPIRGSLHDDMKQTVEVPSNVSVVIQSSRTVRYSTEEEDVRYVLLAVAQLE